MRAQSPSEQALRVERATGIEPAFSAWEAGRAAARSRPVSASPQVSGSGRRRPGVTGTYRMTPTYASYRHAVGTPPVGQAGRSAWVSAGTCSAAVVQTWSGSTRGSGGMPSAHVPIGIGSPRSSRSRWRCAASFVGSDSARRGWHNRTDGYVKDGRTWRAERSLPRSRSHSPSIGPTGSPPSSLAVARNWPQLGPGSGRSRPNWTEGPDRTSHRPPHQARPPDIRRAADIEHSAAALLRSSGS